MSFSQRVAAVAALTLSLAASFGLSAPGRANGLDPKLAPAVSAPSPVLDGVNTSTGPIVPSPASAMPEALTAPADEEPDYDSLAQAVAAQSAADLDQDDVRCLAGAIYFEAKGEPLAGQLAVAEVIINRAKSGRWPSNVCSVITQRGQFGFVRGGRIPVIDEGRASYRTALGVARVALAHAWDSPASHALFFNTPDRRPAARLTRVAAIGNHVFYR